MFARETFLLIVLPLACYAGVCERKCMSNATDVPNLYGRPIRLRWDPWETSQLATRVAAILMKEQLGFDVQLVPGGPVYEAVATGQVDAAFEVWPVGKEQAFQQYASYLCTKGARAYNTSIEARGGIYEACSRDPGSELRQCKDTRFFGTHEFLDELLATAEGEAHFARTDHASGLSSWAPDHCAEGNCSAEILHITPDYDPGVIEGMVSGLKLPATVTFLGLEHHRDAVWAAYMNRSAALFYFHSPGMPFHGIPIDAMPRATVRPGKDSPGAFLQKLVRNDLENRDGLDAVAFVENFALGEADYADLTRKAYMMQDVEAAACEWVKTHTTTWASWISFPQRREKGFGQWFFGECATSELGDRFPCDRGCTTLVFLQFILGALLALFMFCCWPLPGRLKRRSHHEAHPHVQSHILATIEKALAGEDPAIERLANMNATYAARNAFRHAYESAPMVMRHVRTFSNFCKTNADPELKRPPDYPAERWNGGTERFPLYLFGFFSNAFTPVLLRSVALALLSSGQATVVWIWLRYRAFQVTASGLGPDVSNLELTREHADTFDNVTDSFKFFPAFLLLGYVGYAVNQWRAFLSKGYSIQGRIHDVSLMVGGAISDPASQECRQLAFKVYRYLTLAHVLVYKAKHPWLAALSIDDLMGLGLVAAAERARLEPAKNKMRDTVLAELSWEIQRGIEKGLLRTSCTVTCLDQLARLRGYMAAFHDSFQLTVPNVYASLMTFVVDMLVFVFVIGTSYTAFVYESGCFQVKVFFATVFLTMPWVCCMDMISTVMNPFASVHDFFNVDSLICSSEQCSFHNLRISFDQPSGPKSWLDGHEQSC